MRCNLLVWSWFIVLFACSQNVLATHIVGGEMGYTCLGNDEYEIRLTIYRDCFYGNPNAYFDNPASIGVFDANNNLLQDIRLELMNDDTLAPVLTDECLVIPPDVCVHTTTYRSVVTLPVRAGGYQLAYQRCCRNQTIENIVEPLATGATYGVIISERALQECNTSAAFLQWPPLYICVNEPILFDQSAADVDGDSIVYRLCTPLQGADQNIPRPQPPNNPPYDEVVWDIGYNVDNMLNGLPDGVPLRIDSETGLLTGIPNTIGQFVVGICAEEYRNGELISTTRRDFQYNVGVCGEITAAFFAPQVQCGDLNVSFTNQSLGANTFLWNFGDESTMLDFSEDPNPTYTFPDTGVYQVQLIASPGGACADTMLQTIRLLPERLFPDFAIDTLGCGDSLSLQLTDLSTTDGTTITNWQWLLDDVVVSNEQNPQISLTQAGVIYTLGLRIQGSEGCRSELLARPALLSIFEPALPDNNIEICYGEEVELWPAANTALQYEWSPVNPEDVLSPNPLVTPLENTTYFVTVTEPETNCIVNRSVDVAVADSIEISIEGELVSCAEDINLLATSPTGVNFRWSESPTLFPVLGTEPAYTASIIGEVQLFVGVSDQQGCQEQMMVTVNSQAVNVALPPLQEVCLGETINVAAELVDPEDMVSWQWSINDLPDEFDDQDAISFLPLTPGEYQIHLTTTNQFDCTASDSTTVVVLDTLDQLASLSYLQCSGYNVQFSSTSPQANVLQWQFGDPTQPTASGIGASVSHTYEGPGTYEVVVTYGAGLVCADTLQLMVTLTEPGPLVPAFDWEYLVCSDTTIIQLTDVSTGLSLSGTEWFVDNQFISTAANVDFMLTEFMPIDVRLEVVAENGCLASIEETIQPIVISSTLQDTIQACGQQPTALYPEADLRWSYQWSPTETLSDSLAANPLVTLDSSARFTVQITAPGTICQVEREVFVQVPRPIEYTLTDDFTTCETDVFLSAAADQSVNLAWYTDRDLTQLISTAPILSTNLSGPTTFYVNFIDQLGCLKVDSVMVNSQAIEVLLDPLQQICINDTARLQVVVLGETEGLTFNWSANDNSIIGPVDGSSIRILPQTDAVYALEIMNAADCVLDTAIQVSVFNQVPDLSVIPARDTLLPGDIVQLEATQAAGYTYLWSPPLGLNATNIANPQAQPDSTTIYTVTVRDISGCTNSADVLLLVLNSPCVAPYIFVPNAFTPNGDNLNDQLLVAGNIIDQFYLAIYDRWGQMIFESFDQRQGWDGSFKGKALPPDVYGYYLEVGCFDGATYQTKGNITLLR